jgi:hypothetical protein
MKKSIIIRNQQTLHQRTKYLQGIWPPGIFKEWSHLTPGSYKCGGKVPIKEYDHQRAFNGDLIQHHRAIHKGKKSSCRECDHQATSKGDLTQQQQSMHEENNYPYGEFDFQATDQSNITRHQQAIH